MDPAANDRKEPGYLTAWKGLAFVAVVLLLLAIMGSFLLPSTAPPFSENVSNASQSSTSAPETGTPVATVPPENNIELRGTQICLPHKDTSGPQTMECAIGLKADDGANYGLDTSRLQPDAVGELYGGARVRIVGHYTPAEALSTDHFHKYDMKGIVQIDIIERI